MPEPSDPTYVNNRDWPQENPNDGSTVMGTYDPSTGTYRYGDQPSGGAIPVGAPAGSTSAAVGNTAAAAAPAAGSGIFGSGLTTSQAIQAALAIYGAYRSSQPGRFQQAPESPALTALRMKILDYINNSPTRNMLGSMLGPRLQASAQNNFQLPMGANGYNPNNTGPRPQYDMNAIFGSIATPSNPSPGTTPAGTQPPGGGPGLTPSPLNKDPYQP